jgi:hypothetical protein
LEFDGGLSDQVRALIEQQTQTWPMLKKAIGELSQAEYKPLSVYSVEMYVQFNPGRIVSTGANVDPQSISRRPCFLCLGSLPPEELGIPFGERFVVLCNPFPVLEDHLVIASRVHTPQWIAGNITAMLDLARNLGDDWFVLYNGPRCGASAPDHFHFQACAKRRLPILQALDLWDGNSRIPLAGLKVFVARKQDQAEIEAWLDQIIFLLADATGAIEEPMINLVVSFAKGAWTVVAYPRQKHRPACYDAEADRQLLVSPAAIDLSGVLVVPQAGHFARITAADVKAIFNEVLLDAERYAQVLKRAS